jgi:heat shock factor-binding protein 1
MSDAIITRIDEMGSRIDDLEKSIGELMTQAGASMCSASCSHATPIMTGSRTCAGIEEGAAPSQQ